MIEKHLVPKPQKIELLGSTLPLPSTAHLVLADSLDAISLRDACRLADDLLLIAGVPTAIGGKTGLPIRLRIDSTGLRSEGYRLSVAPDGIDLVGADAAGLFYAGQTLLQVFTMAPKPRTARLTGPATLTHASDTRRHVECLQIEDWPQYRVREFMADIGRAPFSMPLLHRTIRIMARLKLNSLHLHLHDDQLNGLRYNTLPLGRENPTAMTNNDLRHLVQYARQWHVAVVPEIEAWGHVGSIVYHYPHLAGGPGMYGGFSFGMGEETYELLEKMLDEVVPVLEPTCAVHLGLDEAVWATLPSVPKAQRENYSPVRHVARLHEILQRLGKKHDRTILMRVWADHGGRPIPPEIANEVVVEPWMYMESRTGVIQETVAKYSGVNKPPFMMGGGMSASIHLAGGFGATGAWCQAAMESPNCRGIDICMWGNNNLAGQLSGVFAGADYAWSPMSPVIIEKDNLYRERVQGDVMVQMKRWQAIFRADADDQAIRHDMGAEVHGGFYGSGPLAGKPVAPTAEMSNAPVADAVVD